jgi:hypothetical protein
LPRRIESWTFIYAFRNHREARYHCVPKDSASEAKPRMREVVAKVTEVRPNRPLFVRQLEIIGGERRGRGRPTSTTAAVQIVAVHGTCATEAQYQLLWEAMEQQWVAGTASRNDDEEDGAAVEEDSWSATERISIIAYDFFGLAQSPRPRTTRPEDYANEELQKDLLAVIDQFADADVPLVIMGHSYGPTHIHATLPQIQQRFNVVGLILIGTAVASEHLPMEAIQS